MILNITKFSVNLTTFFSAYSSRPVEQHQLSYFLDIYPFLSNNQNYIKTNC